MRADRSGVPRKNGVSRGESDCERGHAGAPHRTRFAGLRRGPRIFDCNGRNEFALQKFSASLRICGQSPSRLPPGPTEPGAIPLWCTGVTFLQGKVTIPPAPRCGAPPFAQGGLSPPVACGDSPLVRGGHFYYFKIFQKFSFSLAGLGQPIRTKGQKGKKGRGMRRGSAWGAFPTHQTQR